MRQNLVRLRWVIQQLGFVDSRHATLNGLAVNIMYDDSSDVLGMQYWNLEVPAGMMEVGKLWTMRCTCSLEIDTYLSRSNVLTREARWPSPVLFTRNLASD